MPLFDGGPQDPEPPRRVANTSRAAYQRVRPHMSAMKRRILEAIRAAGERGLTVREVAAVLGKLPHEISGRLTDLVRGGAIRVAVDNVGRELERDGARVLILAELAEGDHHG
jgi:hypothetical protein